MGRPAAPAWTKLLSGPTSIADQLSELLAWQHGTSLAPTKFPSLPTEITQQWRWALRSATSCYRADQEACALRTAHCALRSTEFYLKADFSADVNPYWIISSSLGSFGRLIPHTNTPTC